MSSLMITEDSRSIKTKKALYAAMFVLLRRYSFKKITIKSICEEAAISRAAFYTHFIDKYDLLKCWITELWPKELSSCDAYDQLEEAVGMHMQTNMATIGNLLYEADYETLGVLFNFILSSINLTIDKRDTETYQQNIVLANFCAGGILSYLLWQIENKFPPDVPVINRHLYEIINELQDRI